MKKFSGIVFTVLLSSAVLYTLFTYFATFSEGVRSGELIKFSKKGVLIKTWEGEISQGSFGAQIFSFSAERDQKEVVKQLTALQGRYVKVTYFERFGTFFWLGDTKYYITNVAEEQSPHYRQKLVNDQ
jgi:hypothetical protein